MPSLLLLGPLILATPSALGGTVPTPTGLRYTDGPCAGSEWEGAVVDGAPSGPGIFYLGGREADDRSPTVERVYFQTVTAPLQGTGIADVKLSGERNRHTLEGGLRVDVEACRLRQVSPSVRLLYGGTELFVGVLARQANGWVPIRGTPRGHAGVKYIQEWGQEYPYPKVSSGVARCVEGDCFNGVGVEVVELDPGRVYRYRGPFQDGVRHGDGVMETLNPDGSTQGRGSVSFDEGLAVYPDGRREGLFMVVTGSSFDWQAVSPGPPAAPTPRIRTPWEVGIEPRLVSLAGVAGGVAGAWEAAREGAGSGSVPRAHLEAANSSAQALLVRSNELLEDLRAHGCPTDNATTAVTIAYGVRNRIYGLYQAEPDDQGAGSPEERARTRATDLLATTIDDTTLHAYADALERVLADIPSCTRP